MNTRLGKSFGLAFVVAVGILALMFALGTFNAQKAAAAPSNIIDAATVTVDGSNREAGAGGLITVMFNDGAARDQSETIVIKLASFGVPSTIDSEDVTISAGTNAANPSAVAVSGKTITLVIPDMNDDTGGSDGISSGVTTTVRFQQSAGITVPTTSGTYGVEVNGVLGAEFPEGATPSARDLVNAGFGSTEHGGLTQATTTTTYGIGDTPTAQQLVNATEGSIIFTIAADEGIIGDNGITIERSVKLSKTSGARGTDVTITGKGFGKNINAIFVDTDADGAVGTDDITIATSISVDDGAFSYDFTVGKGYPLTSYINVRDVAGTALHMHTPAVDADADATPAVEAADAMGDALDTWPTFSIKGGISVGDESVKRGEKIKVSFADFTSDSVADVKIGNVPIPDRTEFTSAGNATAGMSGSFMIEVPTDMPVGQQQISATIGEVSATASVTIGGLPLTVSPDPAVPGQEVTIRGSGFSKGGVLARVDIDGHDALPDRDVHITSSGTFVATVTIPPGVSDTGDAVLVEVQEDDGTGDFDGHNRVGTARMTIPEPTLTLNPIESRADTTVTASGTGFVARSVVSIDYAGTPRLSVTADSLGNWTQSFRVPIDREPGTTGSVKAEGAGKSKSADHKTPGPTINVTPTSGRPGDTITITGIDFKAYAPVTSASIGGLTIPTGATNTNEDGNFTLTATLPSLPSGTQSLTVSVNQQPETVVFTITEAGPATLPSADAFADLISANNLIVVWYFDNDTKGWSFYDPRPEVAAAVDLDMVTSGDNVWIQVVANQMFQGEMLTGGWNSITIN
jgi:hypothetical protein